MICDLCKQRGQTWAGDPPICAFDGNFADNWNCATLNAIRDLCYEGQDLPQGIDCQYCDDSKYATINISEVEVDGDPMGYALWVLWYKNRGNTEEVLILDALQDGGGRRPTEKELRAIIDYCKKEEPKP